MGLIASVYRNAELGDCTNGGISSKATRLCLVNVDGPFSPTDDAPAALLVAGNLPGTLKIVPAVEVPSVFAGIGGKPKYEQAPASMGWMMGGNYGATSDSRFNEACERLLGHRFYGAVAIHDRTETPEQYDRLSR